MDKADLTKTLKEAKKAIDLAIEWIATNSVAEEVDRYEVATCLYCKNPIYSDEPVIRQIHRKPCYNEAQTLKRNGEVTFEQLEQQGKMGPQSPSGRPRKTAIETLGKSVGGQEGEGS